VYEGIRIQAGFEYVDRRQSGDKSVQNLYTGASVTPVRNVTIFARVNNLLNKQYVGTDFYPAEKLGFIAGVKWLF
jgi:outer membrane receptor protein involved in Fe transport